MPPHSSGNPSPLEVFSPAARAEACKGLEPSPIWSKFTAAVSLAVSCNAATIESCWIVRPLTSVPLQMLVLLMFRVRLRWLRKRGQGALEEAAARARQQMGFNWGSSGAASCELDVTRQEPVSERKTSLKAAANLHVAVRRAQALSATGTTTTGTRKPTRNGNATRKEQKKREAAVLKGCQGCQFLRDSKHRTLANFADPNGVLPQPCAHQFRYGQYA
jgi:hypothetical protein